MKTVKIAFLLIFAFSTTFVLAQNRAKEKDIIGNWKIVIEIEDALDEAKDDLDDDGEVFAKLVLSSVSSLVENIIDEIDIYIEFMPNGKLEINVNAFDEEEIDYGTWELDSKGRLYIDDTDDFDLDNDYWILKDGVLVNSDPDSEKYVYMVNLDK
ncbi:MAG: hypothetical protein JXR03_13820 [Cyclobacteriaceae bacterium]